MLERWMANTSYTTDWQSLTRNVIVESSKKKRGATEITIAGGMLRGTAIVSLYVKHPAKTWLHV